jgi:PleD family two-component response regulator
MMPGMNGLEVLTFLRRVDSLIDLPIIMVTAKGEREDMVEALELGANDYEVVAADLWLQGLVQPGAGAKRRGQDDQPTLRAEQLRRPAPDSVCGLWARARPARTARTARRRNRNTRGCRRR